jgi:hypothetical protein
MMAQLFFTLVLAMVMLVALSQMTQMPIVAGLVACTVLFGTYLVWRPEDATYFAHLIGIGRGADLLLYVWVLISFAILLVLYLSLRQQMQMITALARSVALREALANSAQHASHTGTARASKQSHLKPEAL